jgi:acyl-CoA synthetase (AMP-forming)/AMP-acid ligase II
VLSDALPKTERGKLDRKALVEKWAEQRRTTDNSERTIE